MSKIAIAWSAWQYSYLPKLHNGPFKAAFEKNASDEAREHVSLLIGLDHDGGASPMDHVLFMAYGAPAWQEEQVEVTRLEYLFFYQERSTSAARLTFLQDLLNKQIINPDDLRDIGTLKPGASFSQDREKKLRRVFHCAILQDTYLSDDWSAWLLGVLGAEILSHEDPQGRSGVAFALEEERIGVLRRIKERNHAKSLTDYAQVTEALEKIKQKKQTLTASLPSGDEQRHLARLEQIIALVEDPKDKGQEVIPSSRISIYYLLAFLVVFLVLFLPLFTYTLLPAHEVDQEEEAQGHEEEEEEEEATPERAQGDEEPGEGGSPIPLSV